MVVGIGSVEVPDAVSSAFTHANAAAATAMESTARFSMNIIAVCGRADLKVVGDPLGTHTRGDKDEESFERRTGIYMQSDYANQRVVMMKCQNCRRLMRRDSSEPTLPSDKIPSHPSERESSGHPLSSPRALWWFAVVVSVLRHSLHSG